MKFDFIASTSRGEYRESVEIDFYEFGELYNGTMNPFDPEELTSIISLPTDFNGIPDMIKAVANPNEAIEIIIQVDAHEKWASKPAIVEIASEEFEWEHSHHNGYAILAEAMLLVAMTCGRKELRDIKFLDE